MSDQPLYPYRDTTGDTEQPADQQYAQQQQYPQQQYPQQQYPQQQYPQPYAQQSQLSYGSPPPQASQQYQMPQPQAYPPQYANQMGGWYGMGMMSPSNGVATAALVLGIIGTLIAIGGYLAPNIGFFFLVMLVAVPSVLLGFAGIMRSRHVGGFKFGHALAGIVLGVASVTIFCVLASSQAGSLSNVFTLRSVDPAVSIDDDDDDDRTPAKKPLIDIDGQMDVRSLLKQREWSGFIKILDGEQKGSYATTKFTVDCGDGDAGTFTWDEADGNYDPKSAKGKFSVLFGQEALDAATKGGFGLDILGGESFASYVLGEDELDLIYMEFEPEQSDSTILTTGEKLAWFGYIDCQFGEMYTINVYRLSDHEYQFFNAFD